jgi:hypothetical protein
MQLPLIAMAVVGLSAAVANACHDVPKPRCQIATWALASGIAWMAVSAISVWPNALQYTNEAWGGRECGFRLLSDSNYDWGQGLKELAQWQREHQPDGIDIWYFGTDPASQRPPFRSIPLHALPITDEQQLRAHLNGRYFAVGTTVLFGSYCPDPNKQELIKSLRSRLPIARTATFLIFDLRPELATTAPTRTEATQMDQPTTSAAGAATPTTR